MTFRATPDEAVEAGAPASPYLMRNLRDNDEAIANAATSFGVMLDGSVGHVHGTGTRVHPYTFTDRVTIKTGVNDKVPFRFGGAGTNYSSTLTAGVYTLTALAAEIQTRMRASAGATTLISVVYDLTEGSPTRGLFVFRHTGSSDPRVFELHFATGTGFAAGVGPSIGFAKLDKKKSFSYAGDSGFSDGYAQDEYTMHEGGLLDDTAWVAGAFTAAKLGPDVISTRCFQTDSVSGSAGSDKIGDGELSGDKTGAPEFNGSTPNITAGSSNTFTVTVPNGGAGRRPMAVPFSGTSCAWNLLVVTGISHVSGNDWHVTVRNDDVVSHAVGVVAY